MGTHSSILAWRIPWTEEPGGLQSIGSQRIGHDWSDLACMHASARYYAHCKQFTKIDIIQRVQSSELEIKYMH